MRPEPADLDGINQMFKGRSGRRVTTQQQRAANTANDATSMDLDREEVRRNLMRKKLAERGLRNQILQAREAGDLDTMRSLQSELQEITFETRDDVRAINPRGTTADELRDASGRLPGMFRESATQAAGIARGQADEIGGEISAYDRRAGMMRLRQQGIDVQGTIDNRGPVPFPEDGPLGDRALAGYGSNLTPAERRQVDPTLAGGVDVRAGLMARRQAAADRAGQLESAAERGFEPTPFDADALADRIAGEDSGAMERARRRQQERLALEASGREDFDAAMEVTDIGRETIVESARGELAGQRARRDEFRRQGAESRAQAGTAGDRAAAEVDMARAGVAKAETEADLLEAQARLAGAEADYTVDRMNRMAERLAAGGATGPSPEAAAGMVGLVVDPMQRINQVVRRRNPSEVTFADVMELGADMDSVVQMVKTLKSAASSAMPEDRQVIIDEVSKLLPFATPEQVDLVRTTWGDIGNSLPVIDPINQDWRRYHRYRATEGFNKYQEAMKELRELAGAL
jgi:hypothetical protein